MAWLLVDNSNTRTKFALGDAGGLLEARTWIPTAEISAAVLETKFAGWEFEGTLLCSVVPEKARILRDHLVKHGPVHPLTWKSAMGLEIDYPNPEQIGADRLANAIGVTARHGAPAIVIDFGTAVTFDVVSAGPAYCGGVIAPGLGAMQDYLGKRTALLPQIELEEPASAIGKSTVEAMRAGAVFGYRGLVREIVAKLRIEMGGNPVIVATGGDAGLIARGLPEIGAVDPDLTLEGLRLAALMNLA
ncbi:type III pantothenate kinase [Luteolibacter sp. GHJ8]|uniref:Type III pantothenate kinase n=1 Tax=Luteolibacter rhizosphaerae TaxID=2989719 RepID=A0ABT3G981_9BACT|nr:type III pantothenate kinase [Luteolibacter rhizosphaerae]MCW1915755.1 type III pantothenate kinase [Luteolibacter rhizosphaerae]